MRIDAKGVKPYTLLEISEMSLEISGSPTLYLWICNPRGSQPRCSPPVDSEIHRDERRFEELVKKRRSFNLYHQDHQNRLIAYNYLFLMKQECRQLKMK